jgi:hypothetical protein
MMDVNTTKASKKAAPEATTNVSNVEVKLTSPPYDLTSPHPMHQPPKMMALQPMTMLQESTRTLSLLLTLQQVSRITALLPLHHPSFLFSSQPGNPTQIPSIHPQNLHSRVPKARNFAVMLCEEDGETYIKTEDGTWAMVPVCEGFSQPNLMRAPSINIQTS